METNTDLYECTAKTIEGYWRERGGCRGKVGMEKDNYFLLKRKQKRPSIAAVGSTSPGTLSAEEAVMEIAHRDISPLTHLHKYQVTQFEVREGQVV